MDNIDKELAITSPEYLFRTATDVAGLCKDFVVKTAVNIQGRNFVKVEGWQSIAAAHGCIPEIESIEERDVEGVHGIMAWAILRRMSDQAVLSRASGFVGSDEKTWGGRDKYARLAMAQTRAMSRVCRHAFAYVVVMMDAGLETTPAEEMPRDEPAPKPQKNINEPRLQGVVEAAYTSGDNDQFFNGEIKGRRFWTLDEDLGQSLLAAAGTEVIVTLKSGKKPNSYQLLTLEAVK